MPTLARELRRELERTVKEARKTAEAGARKAIDRLGVGDAEAPSGLNPAAKSLRNKLRAHGRQLGDRLHKSGKQDTRKLIEECAYEHWHRLLFARFLAENDLLIEPTTGVAITLSECQELAREQSEDWLPLASNFAQRMLPQIFRPDDPVLSIDLPPETRSKLEDHLKGLTADTFKADDSLGWVYQFWQADRKEEVNASEMKIGADELPAVTQLFTEDYMVLFLLHNTLGAWWAGKNLSKDLLEQAKSEDVLRQAVALPGVNWEYLRFVQVSRKPEESHGSVMIWRPAAGTFEGWPKTAKEIKLLDPCMGSGHFLVFALPILVQMRIAEEGLSVADAVDAVLRDNLFGLEIDPRCTQIAAFNLALAAWKLGGYRELPTLHLACSGLGPAATEEEWLGLLERRGMDGRTKVLAGDLIRDTLRDMHQTFSQAPTLGSLIDPNRTGPGVYAVDWGTLRPFFDAALAAEDDETHERAVTAQGMVKATEMLADEYTLVITNVPYVGRGKQDEALKEYLEEYYDEGKADLATAFVLRCLEFCVKGGSTALVTPQSWLFQTSYQKLRELLLRERQWNLVVRLGNNAFQDMNWWAATTALSTITADIPTKASTVSGIDVSSDKRQDVKAAMLRGTEAIAIASGRQCQLVENPDAAIQFGEVHRDSLLRDYATVYQGVGTGDLKRFVRQWWEFAAIDRNWDFFHEAPNTEGCSGYTGILHWEKGAGVLADIGTARKGLQAKERVGIAIGVTGSVPRMVFLGTRFDCTVAAVVPHEPSHLEALHACIFASDFVQRVRDIDQALSVTESSFGKVPFDLAHWQQVAAEKYPNGLPEPESDDPTQWLFHGRPEHSTAPLQVTVARLLGYRWPAEYDSAMCLSKRARELVKSCEKLLHHADDDGIVSLTPLKGEPSAVDRINNLLKDAYGSEWSAGKLDRLLREIGFADKSLDDWLRNGFFENHCAMFHNRPFIWHIWDGIPNGFHALVNYHRLAGPDGEGNRTLCKLTFSYLGEWIERQRQDQKAGVEGADARLAAALHLRAELEKIIAGEPPYDLFIRWKPLHEQPIGWEPDINDGVRLNIRPFLAARPLGARARNACILRITPGGMKYETDPGKEPTREKANYPWFWSWDEKTENFTGGTYFNGKRWNGLHYTTDCKQKARREHKGKK